MKIRLYEQQSLTTLRVIIPKVKQVARENSLGMAVSILKFCLGGAGEALWWKDGDLPSSSETQRGLIRTEDYHQSACENHLRSRLARSERAREVLDMIASIRCGPKQCPRRLRRTPLELGCRVSTTTFTRTA